MTNEIINTADIAEAEYDGHSEPSDIRTDAVATKEATGHGIEFHISMRDYTQRDMETLIVEAAATQIVGRRSDSHLAKAIEAKCIELVDAKARAALERVSAEIIDQPITPSFGDRKPVTMREFIGLVGREYLTETVDRDGKKIGTDGWSRHNNMTRVEYLVVTLLGRQFKAEIEKATSALISQMQTEFRKAHESVLAEQKARFRDALAKMVS
jgi:hypothetical protein